MAPLGTKKDLFTTASPSAKKDPITKPVDEIIDDDEDEEEEEEDDGEELEGAVFEPPETIKQCHWQRRSIKDLIEMMSTPWLDLNPDYQRNVVWSVDRMTKLINSLNCNFYVPPVIFNVQKVTTENGTERYKRISVDGKQRLTSIREFVNGNIPCTDKNGRKWFFVNNGEVSRTNKRLLSDKFKRKFYQYELLCAEYAALERKQEEDLFSRVQLGVPLTPAEKLKASSGVWQAFAIDIEKEYPELMQTADNKRGRSFQLVLQIFKQLLVGDEYDHTYSSGAAALKQFCERPTLLDESFKATARRVFHTYDQILKKHPETFENHAYSHATKYSPIEFVGAAVLINQYPQRNSPTLLSGDILRLREYLRTERQDLRSNSSTWRCLMEFIRNLERYRGGVNVMARAPVAPLGQSTTVAPPGQSISVASPGQGTPVAPLGQSTMMSRSVADRFRAVNTATNSSPTPPFGAGGEGAGSAKRGSVSGLTDGVRLKKKSRTNYEHIKKEM